MTYNDQMNYLDNVRTELKRMLRLKGDIFIDQLVDEMHSTMSKKGDDYAGQDRLANFKEAGYLAGITAERQCLSLIAVKVARLGNLMYNYHKPNFESTRDSMMDLTTYTVLLQMINAEPDNSPIKWWESEK